MISNISSGGTEEIKDLFDKFESIACDYDGIECWSARELCGLLGYAKWQTFENVLAKAKDACNNAGCDIADHFTGVSKMVNLGSGSLLVYIIPRQYRKFIQNYI